VDIIFKGRHTEVLERFRKHATAKLTKIERMAAKAIRVDVEVSTERNPRQSGRKERVELTITSGGPAIRAEAAAEDRFAALDMALAKLESRLRRANDRRKGRHGARAAIRLTDLPEASDPAAPEAPGDGLGSGPGTRPGTAALDDPAAARQAPGAPQGVAAGDESGTADAAWADHDMVPIAMEGDGPLVVREKFHGASPMAIDQALLEMELVGHDFFLFRDVQGGKPSVVYRRRGYQYGVIRLVEDEVEAAVVEPPPTVVRAQGSGRSNGRVKGRTRLRTS
jgi:ribosomal subunit interface protein